MKNLSFHVRHIENPNVDLDPNDHFTVVSAEGSDFIVPHSAEDLHSFQWGSLEGDDDLHLFVYIDKKPFGATILYNDIDQHW